jgi:uncharacterized protein (TIGR02996 family)
MTKTATAFTPRSQLEAAFIRSIAERPEDLDVTAQAYADWLTDQGLDDEADFIRQADPPAGSQKNKQVRQYRSRLLKLRCPKGLAPETVRLAPVPVAELPMPATPPRGPSMIFVNARHGFVTALVCTWPQFRRWAKGWFAGNPIRQVRLFDYASPIHWQGLVPDASGEYVPTDTGWSWGNRDRRGGLPRELWDRLADFVQEYQSDHGITHRHYDTEENTFRALSDACVSLGRERAGLSPRGSCST